MASQDNRLFIDQSVCFKCLKRHIHCLMLFCKIMWHMFTIIQRHKEGKVMEFQEAVCNFSPARCNSISLMSFHNEQNGS